MPNCLNAATAKLRWWIFTGKTTATLACAILVQPANAAGPSFACFGTTSAGVNPAVSGCPGGSRAARVESYATNRGKTGVGIAKEGRVPMIVTMVMPIGSELNTIRKSFHEGARLTGVVIADYGINRSRPQVVIVLSNVLVYAWQMDSMGARPQTATVKLQAEQISSRYP